MDPELLSTVSACLGVTLVATALAHCLPRRINGVAADTAILRMVRAGDLEGVKRLISTGPRTYLAAYGAAIGAAECASPGAPDAVRAASHGAFTAVADTLAKRWVAAITRGIVGGMLGGLGLYLGQRQGVSPPTWVRALGGVAVIGGVWSLLRRDDVAGVLAHGERDVLPELDLAIAHAGAHADAAAPVGSVE
jgi:hypothetical protein